MHKGSVLIVDDDRETVDNITGTLTPLDIAVYNTKDADEGYSMARDLRPSVVFVNLAALGTTGLGICKKIHNDDILKDVPIVLLTLREGKFDPVYTKLYGVVGFLIKPVDNSRLFDSIRKYIKFNEPGKRVRIVASEPAEKASVWVEEPEEPIMQATPIDECDPAILSEEESVETEPIEAESFGAGSMETEAQWATPADEESVSQNGDTVWEISEDDNLDETVTAEAVTEDMIEEESPEAAFEPEDSPPVGSEESPEAPETSADDISAGDFSFSGGTDFFSSEGKEGEDQPAPESQPEEPETAFGEIEPQAASSEESMFHETPATDAPSSEDFSSVKTTADEMPGESLSWGEVDLGTGSAEEERPMPDILPGSSADRAAAPTHKSIAKTSPSMAKAQGRSPRSRRLSPARKRPKTGRKVLVFLLLVSIAGAGGYFGYQYKHMLPGVIAKVKVMLSSEETVPDVPKTAPRPEPIAPAEPSAPEPQRQETTKASVKPEPVARETAVSPPKSVEEPKQPPQPPAKETVREAETGKEKVKAAAQTPPIAKSKASKPKPVAPKDAYYVQLGIYRSEGNANTLVKKMKGENIETFIVTGKFRSGEPSYRVLFREDFGSRDSARRKGLEIKDKTGLNYSIYKGD